MGTLQALVRAGEITQKRPGDSMRRKPCSLHLWLLGAEVRTRLELTQVLEQLRMTPPEMDCEIARAMVVGIARVRGAKQPT
jgi:hypothetical protein